MSNASIDWNNANKDYGVVQYGGDESLIVVFEWKSVIDPEASRQAGARIYKDVEYVKMFRAGEMQNIIHRPVEQSDVNRFPRQWNQFVMKKSQVPDGTPIDLLFPNNPSVADTLRAYGIHTIQQLSELSAHGIDTIGMAGQEYVNKAKSYLKAAVSGVEVLKMQEEMRKMTQERNMMSRQIEELVQQIKGLTAKLTDPSLAVKSNSNPSTGVPNVPFITGYDAQTDRINATHVTNELKPAVSPAAPTGDNIIHNSKPLVEPPKARTSKFAKLQAE